MFFFADVFMRILPGTLPKHFFLTSEREREREREREMSKCNSIQAAEMLTLRLGIKNSGVFISLIFTILSF